MGAALVGPWAHQIGTHTLGARGALAPFMDLATA